MKWLLITSCVGHISAIVGLDQIERAPAAPAFVPIVFEESPQSLPEPEPPIPPPVDSPEEEVVAPLKSAATSAAPAPASPVVAVEAAAPSLHSLQDLGLELSGTSGGLAVAAGAGSAGTRQEPSTTRRILGTVPQPAIKREAPCKDAEVKPSLTHLPQPAYTEAARTAGISGKVRISITVGPSGQVERASVLKSLGHGLDESALTAARAATFKPALLCGKPSTSTFTISVRFSTH